MDHDSTSTPPDAPEPAERRPAPHPSGIALIVEAGMGDIDHQLDLGIPLAEIARRMFISEDALTLALDSHRSTFSA